ncbi:putative phage holin [Gordonia terrae]
MKRAAASAAATVASGGAVYGLVVGIFDVPPKPAADVLLLVITAAFWAFTLIYGFRSRWQATHAGRVLLYLGLASSLFAAQVSLSAWTQSEYLLRDPIRFILYFALAITAINLVRTLLLEQEADRRDRE